MNRSEDISQLAAALAKAQGQFKPAKKDSEAAMGEGRPKRRYADLASVWDVIREPLASNGLSVVQTFDQVERAITINTELLHESGQHIANQLTLPIPPADRMNPVQVVGSAVTYGRRYGLCALLGIVADEDDDAASIQPGQHPQHPQHPQQRVDRQQQPRNGNGHGQQPADSDEREEPHVPNPKGRFFALWQDLELPKLGENAAYRRQVIRSILLKVKSWPEDAPLVSCAQLTEQQWALAAGALRSYVQALQRKGIAPGSEFEDVEEGVTETPATEMAGVS